MTDDQPDIPRDPHADNELINRLDEFDTPSQSRTSGGRIAREVGKRDEEKNAFNGRDPLPTSVHKGDHPDGGDESSYGEDGSGSDAG